MTAVRLGPDNRAVKVDGLATWQGPQGREGRPRRRRSRALRRLGSVARLSGSIRSRPYS